MWYLKMLFQPIACFFVGHDEMPGEASFCEDDFCAKCLCDWPQDKITLPRLLMRIFCWFVEREWDWFDRFDWWLVRNHADKLPQWWQY